MVTKLFRKHRPPVGSSPGTLVIRKDALTPKIHLFDYDGERIEERTLTNVAELTSYKKSKSVTWIDIQGLGDIKMLEQVSEIFEIHPLALEDVVHVPQRPKIDQYEKFIFIVTAMLSTPNPPDVNAEQLSIFLGKNFVITFQEKYGDILEPIRERIRSAKGVIRKNGCDYLAYAILDTIIDGYYPILETLGEHLEDLENMVVENPSEELLKHIYRVRRELLSIRRKVYPQRELLSAIVRDENTFIRKSVRVYLRDCYDHCAQAIDVLESYRELCSGLMDVYLSGISNRMNEVMKVLTIIATIFIPLSFLTGIYGMNFEHMPELKVPWAYYAFWATIIIVAAGMILFFKRLGWFKKSMTFSDWKNQERDDI